jgi:probable phosphoglycerate mutase
MPNGETMEEFQVRLLEEIKYIIDNNKGKSICIVTHGTAIKALLCRFYGCTLEEMLRIPWHENTSVTVVDYENDKFNVVMEGDASHLGKEMSTIRNQDWWIDNSERLKGDGGIGDEDI